jgi:hypothetical protein
MYARAGMHTSTREGASERATACQNVHFHSHNTTRGSHRAIVSMKRQTRIWCHRSVATSTAEKLRQLSRCVLAAHRRHHYSKGPVARGGGGVHGSLAAWYGALPSMDGTMPHPSSGHSTVRALSPSPPLQPRAGTRCRASYLLGLARGRGLLQQDTVDQEHPTSRAQRSASACARSSMTRRPNRACLSMHAHRCLPAPKWIPATLTLALWPAEAHQRPRSCTTRMTGASTACR